MRTSFRTTVCLLLSPFLLCLSVFPQGARQERFGAAPGKASSRSETGFPRLVFGPSRDLESRLKPDSEAALLFEDLRRMGALAPRAIATADLNADGAPDLVCGYASEFGGFLALQLGDAAVMSPTGLASSRPWGTDGEGGPFLAETVVLQLDSVPDFIAAGDFNANGLLDLVIAEAGSTELILLPGRGDGDFDSARRIDLPGGATALRSGDVNRPDGLEDVVVGVEVGGVAWLLVFEGPDGAFGHEPERIELFPGRVADIALMDLDRNFGVEIVAAVENEIVIVHGRDRNLTRPRQLRDAAPARLSHYPVEARVSAIAAGNFLGEAEAELALLLETGEVRILEYDDDRLTHRAGRFSGLEPVGPGSRAGLDRNPSVRLARVNSSTKRRDDLVLISPSSGDLRILVPDVDEAAARWPGGIAGATSDSWPQVALQVALRAAALPRAVIPLRINSDGFDDLLVLTSLGVSVFPTQAAVTLTVNDAGSDLECRQPASPSGRCTIRGALHYANTHPTEAPFRIEIRVPEISLQATGAGSGGAPYIPPLPVQVPMTIDGNGVVIRGVDGAQWGSASVGEKSAAFYFFKWGARDPSNSTIRGVVLDANGPATGIYIEDVDNITVENCRFGDAGTIPAGVLLANSRNSTIRGNEFHNLSRAGVEIRTTSSGIDVIDNYFGADSSGALPSSANAILHIGNPARSCVVRNNHFAGIGAAITLGRVTGTETGGGHLIQGNVIGLNPARSQAVPNAVGIRSGWHSDSTIGGTAPNLANVIAGNHGVGVQLNVLSDGTRLIGNFIGTSGAGGPALGNGEDGVSVASKDVEIGGEASAGNVIAFNGGSRDTVKGVFVSSSTATGVKILGNSIYSNGGLGIGLTWGNEPTPNDPGDLDTGPNNLQNYPVLTKIPNSGDIELTLDSTPNRRFTIQIFANDECDPSGYGEGQSLLDSFELETVGDGSALAFLRGVPAGKAITATATDPAGNTSEFSKCVGEEGPEVGPFVVNSTGDNPDENAGDQRYDGVCSTGRKADGGPGACNKAVPGDCECTLRAAIQEANARRGKDRIQFNIAGSEPSIAPNTPLPPITAPVEIDGTTQPGYVDQPLIELAGKGVGEGLRLSGGNSVVRGLVINRFDIGIYVNSNDNVIRGNFIGTCRGGSANLCRTGPGSFETAANGIGIFVGSKTGNLIGGPRPSPTVCLDPCNIVSSSSTAGISTPEGNQVSGNFIGTDRKGEARLGNLTGISVTSGDKPTLIGGASSGAGNVISGNREHGIRLLGLSHDVVIEGNRIGTDASGVRNLGNRGVGVLYEGGSGLTKVWIGGTVPGSGNRIAFNKVGVEVSNPTIILSNEVFNNERQFHFRDFTNPLKIELKHPGVTTQPSGSGQPGHTAATWLASALREFPEGAPAIVQFFRSGRENPCEAVELLLSYALIPAGGFEKVSIMRRSVIEGLPLDFTDWLTATVTVPDAAVGTSPLAPCGPPLRDTDGDGIPDYLEEDDRNGDGIPDFLQPHVTSFETMGKAWAVETNAGALGAAIVRAAWAGSTELHANGLLDLVLTNLEARPNEIPAGEVRVQGSAVTVTLTPEPDPAMLPIYVNYGPTPDNPESRPYPFVYDGTTGAEFFFEGPVISKIVLHFVDGERGDHDLERNGVIVTRGGVLSQAAPILYPLQISSANLFSGVGTSNYSDRNASINLFHYLQDGTLQEGFNNPAFTSLYAGRQVAELATEVFDFTPTGEVTGWIRQVSDQSNLSGLLLIGGIAGTQQLDGVVPFEWIHKELYFTRLIEGSTAFRGRKGTTFLSLVHPGRVDTTEPSIPNTSRVRLELLRQGRVIAGTERLLSPRTAVQGRVQDLLGEEIAVNDATDFLRVTVLEGPGVIGAGLVRVRNDQTLVALNADPGGSGTSLFSPQAADLPGALFTSIKLVNTSSAPRQLVLTLIGDAGIPIATARTVSLGPAETKIVDGGEFAFLGRDRVGSLRVEANGPGVLGDVVFGEPQAANWAAALPLQSRPFREAVFSQVANIPGVLFTGLAFLNPGARADTVQIDVYSAAGEPTGGTSLVLGPGERISRLLSELVPSTVGQVTGSIRVTSTHGILAQQLFGDFAGSYLSAVPPKVIAE